MSAYKQHDRVIVRTHGWSEQAFQRFYVTRVGTNTVSGTWETGELKGREATISKDYFDVADIVR